MIAKVRAASGLYTDKEAKQGRARPDRSSQAAVYWTILAIEGKTSPAKGAPVAIAESSAATNVDLPTFGSPASSVMLPGAM